MTSDPVVLAPHGLCLAMISLSPRQTQLMPTRRCCP